MPPWGAGSAACGCPSQARVRSHQLDLVAEAGVCSHDRIPGPVPCLVSALGGAGARRPWGVLPAST